MSFLRFYILIGCAILIICILRRPKFKSIYEKNTVFQSVILSLFLIFVLPISCFLGVAEGFRQHFSRK